MSLKEWLLVIGAVLIVAIVLDGIRRVRGRGRLRLDIDERLKDLPGDEDPDERIISAELPNGGARIVASAAPASKPVPAPKPVPMHEEPTFSEESLEADEDRWHQEPPLVTERIEDTRVTNPGARSAASGEISDDLAALGAAEPQLTDEPWMGRETSLPRGSSRAQPASRAQQAEQSQGGAGTVAGAKPATTGQAKSTPVETAEEPGNLSEGAGLRADSERQTEPQSDVAQETAGRARASALQTAADQDELSSPVFEKNIPEVTGTQPTIDDEPLDILLDDRLLGVGSQRPVERHPAEPESLADDVGAEPPTSPQPPTWDEPVPKMTSAKSAPVKPELEVIKSSVSQRGLDFDQPITRLLDQGSAGGAQVGGQPPRSSDQDVAAAGDLLTVRSAQSPDERKAPAATDPSSQASPLQEKTYASRSDNGGKPLLRGERDEVQASFFDQDPHLDPMLEVSPLLDREAQAQSQPVRRQPAGGEKPRSRAPAPSSEASKESAPPGEDEVLVITVTAKGRPFSGRALEKLAEACGMRYGEMQIYHRQEDAVDRGPIQFSMANAVKPGFFDLEMMDELQTPAVSFFLAMPEPRDLMNAFECMLATAKCVAQNLEGELKDEHRSVMRPQTIEHYRQRIRDFELHRLRRRS